MTLDRLAEYVAANDHTLSAALIEEILALTETPEVAAFTTEFLLPLDREGRATSLPSAVVTRTRAALTTTPGLSDWLQPAVLDGNRVLLVARWLCHRVGLRHRTVQLILDHPTRPDYTLVQVRGFDKVDAPGAFDMPCAGHVVGTEPVEATLAKELGEELGLALTDLESLREIAHYEYRDLDQRPDFRNVEYRTVYRARLRATALDRIHFADGEVAGLAVMSLRAVRDLVARSPELVASGLRGTLRWYVEGSS